jgi:hypothetical protein
VSEPILTPLDLVNLAILEALAGPKAASGDAGSVESHSLKDLLAMQQFLASGAAAQTTAKNRGLRFSRFMPDGTTGSTYSERFPWR